MPGVSNIALTISYGKGNKKAMSIQKSGERSHRSPRPSFPQFNRGTKILLRLAELQNAPVPERGR